VAFNPPTYTIDQGDVGSRYNLGIGTTSTGLTAPDRIYGYCLTPGTKFQEQTDIRTQDKLVQYASPNLIDRDFVNYPRVTDGDFSGGSLQTVFIDPRRYFDSDFDVRIPGYLILRPNWARATKTAITVGSYRQVVAFNGDFWFTLEDTSNNVYTANGGVTAGVGGVASCLETDGQYLYVGNSSFLKRAAASGNSIGSLTTVASAFNGTPRQFWVINLGTQGIFAYYAVGNNTLYKIDLTTSFPVAAGSQAQVALGGGSFYIVDICSYQAGIAILTNDVNGSGFDVWFHDGSNLTRIIRMDGYRSRGLTNCLGALYIAAQAIGGAFPPILARVASGTFDIVARAGSPLFTSSAQECLQPCSSSNFVYWPVLGTQLNPDPNKSNSAIIQYNAQTGAVARLAIDDNSDFGNANNTSTDQGLRNVATLGQSVAGVFYGGTTGYCQYEVSAFSGTTFQPTGWLVSSKLDFNTPSIPKLFRRLIVSHAPLAAGEGILLQAWVDKDPLKFKTNATKGSGSTQYTEQVSNTTAGATQTVLTLPAATVGNALFFGLKLTAGTSNLTTPTVYYISAEIGVPWAFQFTVNCSSQRMDLRGKPDGQGLRGVDLYGLLHDAWESAQTVTLYHPTGNSYTCVIEQAMFSSDSPMYRDSSNQPKDYEAQVTLLLRQSTV
jgi:hypothetical protein